jgi:hypothetical protein
MLYCIRHLEFFTIQNTKNKKNIINYIDKITKKFYKNHKYNGQLLQILINIIYL